MDNSGALAGVGIVIILTYIFAFLPALAGLVFFTYRYRQIKTLRLPILLPSIAAIAGLIQLIVSGPLLSEQISSPLLRIFPVKTVDYAGYNLVAGVVIFLTIVICWRKSSSNGAKNDRKLAVYLASIAILALTIQISGALKYNNKAQRGNQALFSQQLSSAQGFGTALYKVNGLISGNIKLVGGIFEQQDGQITYTQEYEPPNIGKHPFEQIYKVTEVNINSQSLQQNPCLTNSTDINAVSSIDCRQIGTSPNGFILYGAYVKSFNDNQAELFKLFLQKDSTRLEIYPPMNSTAEGVLRLAETVEQITPSQSIINDFLYSGVDGYNPSK